MKKGVRNASAIAARYPLHVRWSDEDAAHLGSIPGLIGDCCHGDSPEEVLAQLKDIAEDLVSHLMAHGSDLPQPASITPDPEPKAIRLALGLSQIRFAQALGISPKTLHKWEQGTSRPSGAARTLLKIAASDPSTVKRALAAL